MDASAFLVTAAGSRVEGFTVHGAYGEGILVLSTSNVVLAGNTVSGNNVGNSGNTSYGECQIQGEIPGDCGEGIHLMTVTGSNVVDNVSDTNSGGMLYTDELGPTTGNTINGNLVQNNADDCGITLPSHNPNALDANGVPQPTMGGVFGNTVSNNMALNNGLRGFGAGILFAAADVGMASYNNTVTGNILNGNGLAGVTIHSHTPNQNVSGDIIQNNLIGQNNLLGDGEFGDLMTTGIAVTAATPQTETINGNTIYDNVKPIFTTDNVTIA
jgi:parallel beta-helix repeat protein